MPDAHMDESGGALEAVRQRKEAAIEAGEFDLAADLRTEELALKARLRAGQGGTAMSPSTPPPSGSTPDPDPIATAVVKALAYQREGLVAALTAILLHGEDEMYPCHAACDADCIDTMRNLAACALAAVDRSPDA